MYGHHAFRSVVALACLLACVLVPSASAQLTVSITSPQGNPAQLIVGQPTTFQAQAFWYGQPLNGASVGWTWTFGDGTGEFTQNPLQHTYATEGQYGATVVATYAGQQAQATKVCQVSASPYVLVLVPDSDIVCDAWDLEVIGPQGPNPMWNVTGFEKRIGEGPWQTADNVQVFAPFVRLGKKVVPCKWLTRPHQNQAIKLRAKVQVQPPGGQGYLAYSNEIEATVQNTVLRPTDTEPEDLAFLYDPDPETEDPLLDWEAIHRAWPYPDTIPDQHFHVTVQVLSLSGTVVKTITGRQDNPGTCQVAWDGSCNPPMPHAGLGLYTYQVTAQHYYTPNGAQHPDTCSIVGECGPDSDKLSQSARVLVFDPQLDEQSQTISGTVTYELLSQVGVCRVVIFGPGHDELWSWDADSPRMQPGTWQTDAFEVPAQIVDGRLICAGQYWAVVFTKQTLPQGLLNRGLEPKWYVPHGRSLASNGVDLWDVEFREPRIQMYWPVRPDDGQDPHNDPPNSGVDEGIGRVGPGDKTPEWTVYRVKQEHLRKRPYLGKPEYDIYATPQPKREPGAFVRNTHVAVKTRLIGVPEGPIWVRATGTLGGFAPAQLTPSGGVAAYQGSTVDALPNNVGVMQDDSAATWNWEWSSTGPEGPWQSLGTTAHTIYRTLATPTGLQKAYKQLFQYSCNWAAGGECADYVFDAIWSHFHFDYEPLYGYYDCECHDPPHGTNDEFFPTVEDDPWPLRSILVYERGRCGHWYLLFKSLIAAHGDDSVRGLGVYPGSQAHGGPLVARAPPGVDRLDLLPRQEAQRSGRPGTRDPRPNSEVLRGPPDRLAHDQEHPL